MEVFLKQLILHCILLPAHMNEQDPWKACQLFREELLDRNSEHRRLSLTLDMFDEPEEQDSSLISFYKMNNVNWAAPFKCHLRGITKMCDIYFINHVNCILFLNNCVLYLVVTCFSSEVIIYFQGDAAVGEGVNRHVLSLVMQKLKTGFSINLGL